MPSSASLPPNEARKGAAGRPSDDDLLDRLRFAVAGRYSVDREIGSGGMAIVYVGHDLVHNRQVAIKVLREDLRSHVAELRFLKEMALADRLDHPNIVPLLDSGRGDQVLFYVMPLVEGETLAERLVRVQTLPIPEALEITRQVAEALDYAHVRGVVHRDVKPQNILLAGDRALLADFGVARAVTEAGADSLTQSGVTVGTTAYMSPEQAGRAKTVDGRADIYSLGCVLYETLAGEPPFTGPNAQVVLARHLAETPPSLQIARPTVSAELEALVETALAKVPADRFPTAAAFRDALAGVARGRYSRRWRPLMRRWRVAIGATAAAAAALTWLAVAQEPLSIDRNKVLVFPLVERGLSQADSGAGVDVALMLGAALEHTEPLRWLDGWQDLDPPERANAALVTGRTARRLTQVRGARFFVDGILSRVGDSLAVVLRLHDAIADSVVAQETEQGRADVPAHRLGLAAIARMLPTLVDPGRRVDVTMLAERDPAAVALWMQGERQYRQSKFSEALAFYHRALRQDSGLAFSTPKGVGAAIWLHRPDDARQLVRAARARESQLPARYAAFARGVEAYLDAHADTAVKWLRQALAANPQWAEAWTALGEVYEHLLPADAPLDSLADAAFTSAWNADSSFTPPLLHLVEIAWRKGDARRARRLSRSLPDSALDNVMAAVRELVRTCVERGRQGMDWRAAAAQRLHEVLLAAKELSAAGAHAGCAEDAFRAVMEAPHAAASYRWAAVVGAHGVIVAQGRHTEAAALLDAQAAAGTQQALYLYVFDVLADTPLQHQAAAVEGAAQQRFGADYRGASPHVQCLLALWHLNRGDLATARSLHQRLTESASSLGTRRVRLLERVLAAHLTLAEGDTAGAITRLRELKSTAPRDSLIWDLWEPLAAERFVLAKLLLARGSYAEAHSVATVFDHPQPVAFLPFLAPSLSIRLRAAIALGNPELAEHHRRRLLRLNRADLMSAEP